MTKLSNILPGDDFLFEDKIYMRALETPEEVVRGKVEVILREHVVKTERGDYIKAWSINDSERGMYQQMKSGTQVIAVYFQPGMWRIK